MQTAIRKRGQIRNIFYVIKNKTRCFRNFYFLNVHTQLILKSHSTTSTAQEKSPELTTSNPWAIDLHVWQEPTCNCTRFLDNPFDLNTVLHFNKLPFYEHF